MKDNEVVKNLRKIGERLKRKRADISELVSDTIESMSPIGGITGIKVQSNSSITLHNHTNSYLIPINMEPSDEVSAIGSQAYCFFETLVRELCSYGVPKRNIEFHLGRDYSSKHHQPAWFRYLS